MRFIIRGAKHEDRDELFRLAMQAPLLSLQADKKQLSDRIENSLKSFSGQLPPEECEYQFVCEDLATRKLAGASSLFGAYISRQHPQHYAAVTTTEDTQHFTRGVETRTFSGIGGLLVDDIFRGTHYKLGSQLSHVRMLYPGIKPERFTKTFVMELLGKVDAQGESLFWDCFGKQFTGLDFPEAYKRIAANNRTFMEDFPVEYDLPYGCRKAFVTENSCAKSSKGSQHLAKKLGFTFQNRIDPVDGALCYSALTQELLPVKNGKWYTVKRGSIKGDIALMAHVTKEGEFFGALAHCGLQGNTAVIRETICAALRLTEGDAIFISPKC